jgi:ribonucleoside-triphosphate reductase
MHECCLNFLNKGLDTKEGTEFAIEMLTYMREKLVEFQKETKQLYNLEASPAEGTSYRLARKLKEQFKDIKLSGTKEIPFLTNSTQLPVDNKLTLFESLEHQNKLQTLYNGGTVYHTYIGEKINDWRSTRNLVKKMAYNTKLPFFSITPTFSICDEHGYIAGEYFNCPECNKLCEVYSRVVGYFRPIINWNDGKREEFKRRTTYKV